MTKQKKPFYKRWWFIGLVILMVVGALGGGDDKSDRVQKTSPEASVSEEKVSDNSSAQEVSEVESNEVEQVEEAQTNQYKAGNYKVGEDIPAGEYVIFADGMMGYVELAKDSSGNLDSIITNDNFETFIYQTISDGQYLKLQMSYAIPAEEMEPYEDVGWYGPGMYKVGYDIPAGEYNVKKEEGQLMAYVEISKDSSGTLESIVTNDNFESNKYITVQDGQYLKIQFGYID